MTLTPSGAAGSATADGPETVAAAAAAAARTLRRHCSGPAEAAAPRQPAAPFPIHDRHTLSSFPASALDSPTSPAPPWVLQTHGLAAQRGDRPLFEKLDIALAPGSVTWLRGRNGRGKTSLLRLLAGLSTPLAGEVRVCGRTLREGGADWRRRLVYIGHQNALKDDLSATESLRFLARLHGAPADDEQLAQALRRMGVFNRRHAPVRTLSQGQRRRVALSRLALSQAAPLWLLDEPFDALDTDGVAALNGVIAEHAAAGGCVLLTSHQPLTLPTPVPAVLDLEPYACA
jgi:heme exporter protein A